MPEQKEEAKNGEQDKTAALPSDLLVWTTMNHRSWDTLVLFHSECNGAEGDIWPIQWPIHENQCAMSDEMVRHLSRTKNKKKKQNREQIKLQTKTQKCQSRRRKPRTVSRQTKGTSHQQKVYPLSPSMYTLWFCHCNPFPIYCIYIYIIYIYIWETSIKRGPNTT